MHGQKIMDELIDEMRPHCENNFHDVSCKCYKLAEEEFKKRAAKSEFWDEVYTTSNLNFEGETK